MNVLEITKVDAKHAAAVVEKLSGLLADMQIFYTNLRGFHWNVKGAQFYQLHAYFETLYDEYATHIDDVAERILQLGGHPTAHFSEYLKQATVQETCSKCCGGSMMRNVAETLAHFMASERVIIELAEEGKDLSTVNLMNGLLDGQEKAAWMLSAYLEQAQC